MILPLGGCIQKKAEVVVAPPLADSLINMFGDIKRAASEGSPEEFFAQLDPDEVVHLKQMASRGGYRSIKPFIERRFGGMPDPDTLVYHELKYTNNYARLTLSGNTIQIFDDRDQVI